MIDFFEGRAVEFSVVAAVFVAQSWLFHRCWGLFGLDAQARMGRIEGWNQTVADLKADQAIQLENIRRRGLTVGELHAVFLLQGSGGTVSKRTGHLIASAAPVELEESSIALDGKEYLALLPALGLLGTFLGIAIALWSADFGSELPIAEMTDQVTDVVRAAGIVFVCSIFGLSFLIAGQWRHRVVANRVSAARAEALAKFDQNVEFQSPVATLARLNFDAFEASASRLGTAATQIASIVGKLSSSADALSSSAKAMETSSKSMKETMEKHIAPFGARIEEFAATSSTFSGSVEGLKASNALASKTSQELAESVRGLTDAMRDGLEASVARMQETMQRMTEETAEASGKFVTQWNKSLGGTLTRMEQVAKSFGDQTEALGTTTKEAMEVFRSQWDETVGAAVGELVTLTEQLAGLEDSMTTTNRQMQSSATSLQRGMEQVRTEFETSMSTLGSTLESELKRAGSAFTSGTDVIASRVGSLDAATTSALGVLEKTKAVSLSIDQAAGTIQRSVRELETATTSLQDAQQKLVGDFFEQAGSAVAELTVQLQDAAGAMKQAAAVAPRA